MDLYVTSFYLRTPFLIPLHFFVADDEFQGVNHPPSPPSPYHGGSGVPEEVHLTLGGMQPRLTRGRSARQSTTALFGQDNPEATSHGIMRACLTPGRSTPQSTTGLFGQCNPREVSHGIMQPRTKQGRSASQTTTGLFGQAVPDNVSSYGGMQPHSNPGSAGWGRESRSTMTSLTKQCTQ